jgi:hypothetical protein
VERILSAGDVPVTILRAAVVIGHGGISWAMTRQLVDHLPAVVTPRWVEHTNPADRRRRRHSIPRRRPRAGGSEGTGV